MNIHDDKFWHGIFLFFFFLYTKINIYLSEMKQNEMHEGTRCTEATQKKR